MAIFEKNDPRQFTVCPSPMANELKAQRSSSQGGLLSALGNISGLEVDNKIFNGLRTMTALSKSVTATIGYDPFGDTDGSDSVLGSIGISGGLVDTVASVNTAVANTAIGSAKNIASKVRSGNFGLSDIPGVLQDFRGIINLGSSLFNKRNSDNFECVESASPYAVDIARFAPKSKFLFVSQFVPSTGYEEMFVDSGKIPAFLIHQFDRPTINFEYEDVNMYNYRTKVLKNTTFEPVSFIMHDDANNHSFKFITAYIRAMSPITNVSNDIMLQESSMKFDELHNYSSDTIDEADLDGIASMYSSSINPLINNNINIFSEMKIFHIYDHGRKMNMYKFIRPKFISVQQDQLDMSVGSSGNAITVQMAYDYVYMQPGIDVDPLASEVNIRDLTSVGLYPLNYNGPSTQSPVNPLSPVASPTGIAGSAADTLTNIEDAKSAVDRFSNLF